MKSNILKMVGLSLVAGILFTGCGTTYEDKIKELDGKDIMTSMKNSKEIEGLYKDWRATSKEVNGFEEVTFISKGFGFSSKCPGRLTRKVYDSYKNLNDNYKNVEYKDFKYNEEDYWVISKTYKEVRFPDSDRFNKYYECGYEAILKDRSLTIKE